MAKKARKGRVSAKSSAANGGKGGTEAPDLVLETISQGKLEKLLKAATTSTKDVASITATMREKIAYAQEHDHLHTGAFAIVRRLNRLEAPKLNTFLAHLDHMLEVSGLRHRAASAPPLAFGAGDDDEQDPEDQAEETDGEQGSTVRPFPRPSSVAAE